MLGGIYTDQKCPICGSTLKNNHRNALACPKHREQKATRFRVYFKGVTRRFSSYAEASRYLNYLRFKVDEGTFDKRDYMRGNPLGFETLACKYLEKKRGEVRCYRNIHNHMKRAIDWFANTNVKDIGYGQIEDFLKAQKSESGAPLSAKTVHNIKTTLHAFFVWVSKREPGVNVPQFPEIKFELGWRSVVSLEDQERILDEVRRLTQNVNRKIWLAIYLLATYPKVRPIELINVREMDIDLNLRLITIRHNKERKPKLLAITEEDANLIKQFPTGLPHLYFFRHERGQHAGKRFGKDLLYKYWKRACANLGIEGVDLYGGTKHSTVRAMREFLRPDEIKQSTGIVSNKAFERYFQHEFEDELKVAKVRNKIRKGKVVKFRDFATFLPESR